jgi:ATP-dependent RNA helicase RhlB
MKNKKDRQTMLFSATMNFKVRNLAWEYMNDPSEVTLSGDTLTVENVSQELYHVSRNEKFKLLLGLMKKLNPSNAIIFAIMKQSVFEVSQNLNLYGHKVQYIIGDLPQTKRLDVIKKLKSGELPFLVATDVAARGLHVDDLELVINYDLPEDSENYVHRIGRTARVGKSGKAISFACESYVYGLPEIEKLIGFKIPVTWPEESDFLEDLSEGMRFRFRDDVSETGARRDKKDKRDKRDKKDRKEDKKHKDSKSRKKSESSEQMELLKSKTKSKQKFDKFDKERHLKDQKIKHGKQIKSKSKETSLEDRLLYYKSKYGENFIPDTDYNFPKKDTLFSKIKKFIPFTVFKRKAK